MDECSEIFDARVENRDKISRLVSAVSERKRESERRQQNTAAPKHSVARNRNSIAAANNIIGSGSYRVDGHSCLCR